METSTQIIIPLAVAVIALVGSYLTRDRASQMLKRLEIIERLEALPTHLKKKPHIDRALNKLDSQMSNEALSDALRPILQVVWFAIGFGAVGFVLLIIYLDAFGPPENLNEAEESLIETTNLLFAIANLFAGLAFVVLFVWAADKAVRGVIDYIKQRKDKADNPESIDGAESVDRNRE